MRVLIVDPYYRSFLQGHYTAHPELGEASYADQWQALMEQRFGTNDAYSHHLRALGIDAHEVVANCAPLQDAWLRENAVRVSGLLRGRLREQAIVVAQARRFEADVAYVQNMRWLLGSTLRRMRKVTQRVVGQIASEPPKNRTLAKYDLVLTSFPHYVQRFRDAGARSEYLKLAFDKRILGALEAESAPVGTRGAVFVGSLHRFFQHRTGNAALAQAAEELPLELWGYRVAGWPHDSPIRRAYRGEAWGIDMYRVLRSARISVNRHIGIAGEFANNMRLYESTGVGPLLLTDAKVNLPELFEPDLEVATYRDGDELVEKIAHYLEDDSERASIAAAGQSRTLRDHTYEVRMAELADMLEHELQRKR